MNRLIAILMVVTVLCGTPAMADTMYVVTDLGTLGGPNSVPTAINSSGVVTGWADPDIGGTAYAFVSSSGSMQSLGTLPSAVSSDGMSINDSGWVVGQSGNEAFVYTSQTGMQAAGFLSGGTSSVLCAINNSNVSVGGSDTAGVALDSAVIWDPTNGMRNLNNMIVNPPVGWAPTLAIAISQNGLIAGIGSAGTSQTFPPPNQHAFVLSGGSLTVIPGLGIDIQPAAINSIGEVVGTFFDANYKEHAFVYTAAAGTRDLGNLGGSETVAYGVNDFGQVVGGTTLSDGDEVAFLYTDSGGMVNLDALAPTSQFDINCTTGINDNGQIIAEGVDASGNGHALLLTPTPEPSTLGLLIAFACFILILQLCHRKLGETQAGGAWPRRAAMTPSDSRGIRLVPAFLTIMVAFCTVAASADTIAYSVQDLGVLGGASSNPTGINSSGQVTGTSDGFLAGTGLAFLWTAPGPMQSLGTLPGNVSSLAHSINDSGWVCGDSDGEAYVYTPQYGMQGVGYLGSGNSSTLYSINNAGVAVGGSTTLSDSRSHAVIWNPTNGLRNLNSTIVNPPGGWTPTAAVLINNNGLIAGIGYSNINTSPPSGTEYAFLLNGGTLSAIPNGGGAVYPQAMNASGEVVGYGSSGAFEYSTADGMRTIGSLGWTRTLAFGVNDLGVVVGGGLLSDGSDAAFLYTDADGMVNLNTLVSMPNGYVLDAATGINDSGQIIAQGGNAQDETAHTFLLTPTPEPSTFVLLINFACFLLILQLCRRRLARL